MSGHIRGCKLPRHLENPVDDWIMGAVEPALAPLHARGITPNAVTVASMAAAAASVYFCFRGEPLTAASLWVLNYVCDVIDGFMARRYRMETTLGGCLDHVSDVAAFCALMVFVWTRLAVGRPAWPLAVEGALLLGSLYHLQCQEKETSHMPFDGIDGRLCLSKQHLQWTRWVGTGTLTVWHVFLIFFYAGQ